MGYGLLWLETLAGELLLLATLVACIARVKWAWLRTRLLLLLVLIAEAAYAGLLALIEWLEWKRIAPDGWGNPGWMLTILLAVGAVIIALGGARRSKGEPTLPAGATWPLGKLAVAFAVVFALNLMTFWNLDAAVRQRVDALRIEAGALALSVAPARVPDRDNAALVYEKAFELMGSEESFEKRWDAKWTEWVEEDGTDCDPQDAKIGEFLADQAPALAVLRGVVNRPACYFHHEYARPTIAILLPEAARIRRQAARLLALDARCRIAAGDVPTAIDDVNALFAMAEHTGTIPIVVGMLVAGKVEDLAIDRIEEMLASEQVSAEELARLHVPETLSYHRLFDRAIRMEEALLLSTFYEYGASLRVSELLSEFDMRHDVPVAWLPVCAPWYRVFLLDEDVACYQDLMQHTKRLTARPFHEAAEDWKAWSGRFQEEVRGLLTNIMMPAVDDAAEAAAKCDARHRLAQFAEAVARHRAAAGDYPEDLDEWASAIRPDPFDGKPLKWKTTDEALLLYSIGPDRKDDGGMPIEGESKTGDIVFRLPK